MQGPIWTVVPMRGIESGKSRLAPLLGPAGRAQLNRWLLARTLAVVARWSGDPARTIVVSPCERALAEASCAGATPLREAGGGLNGAVALAARAAAAAGAGHVLVLPCDLPALSTRALGALVRPARQPRHVVLAPDRAGTGTNALLAAARPEFGFCFGESSFLLHRAWAAERGWTVSLCARRELAFDLDTPADVESWIRREPDRGRRHGVRRCLRLGIMSDPMLESTA